ncbi:MAG: NADH-quinone oxidoreductase subunit NuoE [Bacteroidetes bacterium]|nr:NADH-quinone oxidoreductase subunit NuoE [Bacteroidota bacterium]
MKNTLKSIIQSYPEARQDALIPVLQELQEAEGYISEEAVIEVGKHLKMPSSKIYGVATFYNQFRFEPKGKHHIQVCRGTACHVLGSKTVLEEIEKLLKIKAGQTTRDGLFSIEVVACIGACGLAPVICIDGEFHAKVTADSIAQIIETYRTQEIEQCA